MKKHTIRAIIAAALVTAFVSPIAAQASTKVITIWADNDRGPALSTFLLNNPNIAPGYKIKINTYADYNSLDGAYQKATAATGPDIMFNPIGDAIKYAQSGKVLKMFLSSHARTVLSNTALKYGQWQGSQYGLPLDIDTTAMYWNTAFGPAPKTFAELIADFQKAKAAGTATLGFCAADGTWGALPFLTALGGGAYGYVGKSLTPDPSKVLINSSALVSNIKQYAVGSDGKSNGLFGWDGCKATFLAGKALAMNSGAWQLSDVQKSGVKYVILPTPTLTGSGVTHQWAGYGGAWITSFAAQHNNLFGVREVINYLASDAGALAYAKATNRPSPNTAITAQLSSDVQGFAQSGSKNGLVQLDDLLGDNTGGSNYYDTLTAAFTAIFINGKDVQSTLDNAAKIFAANFQSGFKKL